MDSGINNIELLSLKKILRKLLPAFISIALILYCYKILDLNSFIEFYKAMEIIPFFIIFLCLFINIIIVTFRLDRLLTHFGYPIDFLDTLKASVNGFFSSLFIFSFVGSIIGRQFFLQRKNVPLSACTLISTYERFIIFFVSLLLFLLGIASLLDSKVILNTLSIFPLWQIFCALILIFFTVSLFIRSPFEAALWRQIRSLQNIIRFGEISLLTIIAQTLILFAYLIAVLQVSPDASFLKVLAASAVVSFAASLPISINGWGVREIAASIAFQQVGLTGTEAIAISAFIGIASTAVVLIYSAAILRPASDKRNSIFEGTNYLNPSNSIFIENYTHKLSDKTLALILPSATTILVFFQVHAQIGSGVVTINIADAFAVLGIFLIPIMYFLSNSKVLILSGKVKIWIFSLTCLVIFGFLQGWINYGLHDWALQNRLIGWFVLLGYFCIGALLIDNWGMHGLRRMVELIVVSAAIITAFNLALLILERVFGLPVLFESNFEGFSANRNTFAFQLILALVCAFTYSDRRGSGWGAILWTMLTAVLLYGVWQTQSKAGILVTCGLTFASIIFGIGSRKRIIHAIVLALTAYLCIRFVGFILSDNPELAYQSRALAPNLEVVDSATYLERIESFYLAINLWFEHFFWGTGLGGFLNLSESSSFRDSPIIIHSTILWILVEFGLIGMLVTASLPIYGAILIVRRRVDLKSPSVRILLAASLCFFTFSLVHEISFQRLFWLMLGALIGATGLQTKRYLLSLCTKEVPPRPIVFHIINSLNRGGAESMLLALIKQQQTSYQPVVISLMQEGALSERVSAMGIPCHHLNFKRNYPDLLGMIELICLIRTHKPSIIQGWMYHGDLASLLALFFSGRRQSTKLIWGIRCSDMDLSKYRRALWWVIKTCVLFSKIPDAIIANSEAGARVHKQLGYHPERMDVIHNGIDTSIYYPRPEMREKMRLELGLPQDARVLFHVARVDPMKNHIGLLRAVSNIENIWLVMIGKGTQDLPPQERVIALGQRADVADLLQAGDGVISSSLYGEGFSNALAEGMACGLTPIATESGDSSIIVGETGWSIPTNDPAALKASILAFCTLPEQELRRKGNAAYLRIMENFGLPVMARAYSDLYGIKNQESQEISFTPITASET